MSTAKLRIETSPKRIRVLFQSVFIADTTEAKLVWEHPYYPTYYLPESSVSTQYLHESKDSAEGEYKTYDLAVQERVPLTDAVKWYKVGQLKGFIRFEFGKMDQWFEEDSPVYVHARDPYKRVDVLPSTRNIRVSLNGNTLAQTSHAHHLFETFLITRYYLPITSVGMEFLRPSETRTKCPYKGEAHYYDVVLPNGETFKDLVWSYRYTTLESAPIQGLVCFYNEKVDIELDGKALPRPESQFLPPVPDL